MEVVFDKELLKRMKRIRLVVGVESVKCYWKETVRGELEIVVSPSDNREMGQGAASPVLHPVLYQRLKQYRLQKSKEREVAAYVVFPNAVLVDLCNLLPMTKDELMMIPGFGEGRLNEYGHDVLKMVDEFQKGLADA